MANRALSPEQEKELIVGYEDGYQIRDLAQKYKIGVSTVYRILRRNKVRKRDAPREKFKPEPTSNRKLRPCGTVAAYRRHIYHNEFPCQPCVDAQRERFRKLRKSHKKKKEFSPCGTDSGYRRHYRNGEKPCRACMDAHNEGQRQRYEKYGRSKGRANGIRNTD